MWAVMYLCVKGIDLLKSLYPARNLSGHIFVCKGNIQIHDRSHSWLGTGSSINLFPLHTNIWPLTFLAGYRLFNRFIPFTHTYMTAHIPSWVQGLYWRTCTQSGMWAVIYLCVKGIDLLKSLYPARNVSGHVFVCRGKRFIDIPGCVQALQ
jgi:hypothetical protein